MRKLTILATLATVAFLSIPDSASACWRWRSGRRQQCNSYVPVAYYYYPSTYTGPVVGNAQQSGDSAGTTTDTGATDTGSTATSTGTETEEEAVTPEEQKWLNELNEGKTSEEKTKLDDLWKGMNHKDRSDFYQDIQKAKKEAQEEIQKTKKS
jgi:hypothetical protein